MKFNLKNKKVIYVVVLLNPALFSYFLFFHKDYVIYKKDYPNKLPNRIKEVFSIEGLNPGSLPGFVSGTLNNETYIFIPGYKSNSCNKIRVKDVEKKDGKLKIIFIEKQGSPFVSCTDTSDFNHNFIFKTKGTYTDINIIYLDSTYKEVIDEDIQHTLKRNLENLDFYALKFSFSLHR